MPHFHTELTISFDQAGPRLDQFLAQTYPDYSRSRWQQWIVAGAVLINKAASNAKYKLREGDHIAIDVTIEEQVLDKPQAIALDIIHADKDIIVLNKPAGLVVHPAAGNRDSTLLNALLHYAPELAEVPRAGIVHRLDKDTSGLLMVARNLKSHTRLVRQLQAREIHREYLAIARGKLIAGATVHAPIGRHPKERVKMAVIHSGKPAVTHYRIAERFAHYTLLQVQLETGRTHQIRVHLAHVKHPLLGDQTYGGRLQLPAGSDATLNEAIKKFKRQALHAYKLGLEHPGTREYIEFEVQPPQDFLSLLEILREYDHNK